MLIAALTPMALVAIGVTAPAGAASPKVSASPSTPIKHLVVIVDAEASFDHYFGTYPVAANTDGTPFTAAAGTPAVNGLTPALLTNNPNDGENPQRLTSSEALTCDQDHSYGAEEQAFDGGAMDKFPQYTEQDICSAPEYSAQGLGMDYYDGNTVTGLWNYAQHFAMSDNNYQTTFGPDTPAVLNLVSGDTAGAQAVNPTTGTPTTSSAIGSTGALYSDIDPFYDQCSDQSHSSTNAVAEMTGTNIGNLLDNAGVTWGWFQGGFAPTGTVTNNGNTYAQCGSVHTNIGGETEQDYVPHNDPFQYYASTANPAHLPPSSLSEIGSTDQANHQYDLSYLTDALDGTGGASLPAVSFLAPAGYESGHGGSSDPLDEQHFLVNTINEIEASPYWPSTAIVVTYADSGGWYDHSPSTIVNGSNDPVVDTTLCSSASITLGTANDRCGYGPRIPLLAISPYAPSNTVSHVRTDQTSITRFIEDNWLGGSRIGGGSYDADAGSLDGPGGLLNFSATPHDDEPMLDPTSGAVTDDLVLTPPANVVANATGPAGAVVTYLLPTVSDPYLTPPLPTPTCSPASGSTFAIATTTVNCSATDADGNSAATSFTVTVLGAAAQLTNLGQSVAKVGPGGILAGAVNLAAYFLATGHVGASCLALVAFEFEAKLFALVRVIPVATATSLVATAERIRAVMAC
ncbi:MAG TPA: alkaline phosphatase family protein [Acidimicrobiales bacterium]|nr:alkaline phosphatase family protein [Acidimicrobiales bacterium]